MKKHLLLATLSVAGLTAAAQDAVYDLSGMPEAPAGTYYRQVTGVNQIVPGGRYIIRAVNGNISETGRWTADYFLTSTTEAVNETVIPVAEFLKKEMIEAEGSNLSADNIIWTAEYDSQSGPYKTDIGATGIAIALKDSNGKYFSPRHGNAAVNNNQALYWDRVNYVYATYLCNENTPATTGVIFNTTTRNDWASHSFGQLFNVQISPTQTTAARGSRLGVNVYPNGVGSNVTPSGIDGFGEICAGSTGQYAYATTTSYFVVYQVVCGDAAAQISSYDDAIATALNLYPDCEYGEGLGKYRDFKPALKNAKTEEEIQAALFEVPNDFTLFNHLNMPQGGEYVKVRTSSKNPASTEEVQPILKWQSAAASHGLIAMADEKADGYSDENTLFYYVNDGSTTKLLCVDNGLYVTNNLTYGSNSNHMNFATAPSGNSAASQVRFVSGTDEYGVYQMVIGGNLNLHFHAVNDGTYPLGVNRCTHPYPSIRAEMAHNLALEEVKSLPVKFNSDGFALFYAAAEVSVPDDVAAYAIEINTYNNTKAAYYVALNGNVPANTAVLLKSTANAVHYMPIVNSHIAINTLAQDVQNDLSGSLEARSVGENENIYTLGTANGKPALVKAAAGSAYVGAYVNVSEDNAPESFEVIDKTTVSIEEIEYSIVGEHKIYDLQGRRLGAPVKGINIINGRKVLVK